MTTSSRDHHQPPSSNSTSAHHKSPTSSNSPTMPSLVATQTSLPTSSPTNRKLGHERNHDHGGPLSSSSIQLPTSSQQNPASSTPGNSATSTISTTSSLSHSFSTLFQHSTSNPGPGIVTALPPPTALQQQQQQQQPSSSPSNTRPSSLRRFSSMSNLPIGGQSSTSAPGSPFQPPPNQASPPLLTRGLGSLHNLLAFASGGGSSSSLPTATRFRTRGGGAGAGGGGDGKDEGPQNDSDDEDHTPTQPNSPLTSHAVASSGRRLLTSPSNTSLTSMAIDSVTSPGSPPRSPRVIGANTSVGVSSPPSASSALSPGLSTVDRLGGASALRSIVDDVAERMTQDWRLMRYFTSSAGGSGGGSGTSSSGGAPPMTPQLMSKKIYAYLHASLGGNSQYTGPSLFKAHAQVQISEEDYRAFLAHFQAALLHANVPIESLIEIMSTLKNAAGPVVGLDSWAP